MCAQVRAQVDAQVDAQVCDQVCDQVDDLVDDQVRDQVDALVRALVRDQVRDQVDAQVYAWYRSRIAGQHWASVYAWAEAMASIGVAGLHPLDGQMQIARSAGWWWPYRSFAVITDRPHQLKLDHQGRMHNPAGPAIQYRDGWGFHVWHGRRVPEWVITEPSMERIAGEKNSEIRRCGIESMGWERFTAQLGTGPQAVSPDPGNPGQQLYLYDIPERLWGSRVKLVLCTNGTPERDGTRRRYGQTVPHRFDDPVEAVAWTTGLSKEQYARTVRRT